MNGMIELFSAKLVARVRVVAAGLMACLTVVALAGCGNSGGVGSGSVEQDTSAEVTLKYWTWFPPESTLQKVIDKFEQENPDITVELRSFKSADYQKQLPIALNGGQALDVVGVQVSAMTNTVRARLHPVEAWQSHLTPGWRDKLTPEPLRQATEVAADDKLYSIPMGSVGTVVMYYNPELLAAAGITRPPATMSELASAAAALTRHDSSITPVVNSGAVHWQEEMLFSLACQTAPRLSDEILHSGKSWNSPEVVSALTAYRSLHTTGVLGSSTLDLTDDQAEQLFTTGKAGFYFAGSWRSPLMSERYRATNNVDLSDVGAAPLPLVNGGTPCVRAFAEGGLAIPRASTHVKQAAKFIEFMTTGDGVRQWGDDLTLVPAVKEFTPGDGVLTTDPARRGFQVVADLIAKAPASRDTVQAFNNNVEGNTILDVLRGRTSPEQAAAHLQEEWTSGRYEHP